MSIAVLSEVKGQKEDNPILCNPYELCDLYEMLVFNAHRFFNISSTLSLIEHTLTDDNGNTIQPTVEFCEHIATHLITMRSHCQAIGLSYSILQIDRILAILEERDRTISIHANLAGNISGLSNRIQDELQLRSFMCLPKERTPFYSDPRGQFGKPILDKFPSIVSDVESAGKCYATGNPTACVFHLMRVMEHGLRALGRSLNDESLDPETNPGWEKILWRCDSELKKRLSDRSDLWKQDDNFYSQATANLRAVKDAWRNPTMHVKQSYDDEQAFIVYTAVRGFMRHLAEKLSE